MMTQQILDCCYLCSGDLPTIFHKEKETKIIIKDKLYIICPSCSIVDVIIESLTEKETQ